jgi:hypothetical protein
MLQARLVDEVLNAPPQLPLRATTAVHGAIGRATDGGRVGVVGRPAQAFFAPTVALARMDLTVAATGFLPLALESAVGPQPGYPAVFDQVLGWRAACHQIPDDLRQQAMSWKFSEPLMPHASGLPAAGPPTTRPRHVAASHPAVSEGLYRRARDALSAGRAPARTPTTTPESPACAVETLAADILRNPPSPSPPYFAKMHRMFHLSNAPCRSI